MSTIPCAFCGGPTPQTAGRRAKKYCSDTCRQKDFQKRKKGGDQAKEEEPLTFKKVDKKTRGGLIKHFEPVFPAIVDEFSMPIDLPMMDTRIDEPKKWQEAEIVKTEIKLPNDFNELKRMAEAGVSDVVKFKDHLASTKLNHNQKSMILSKLK